MKYVDELVRSMNFLEKKKETIFLGQSVKFSGNSIFGTLKNVKNRKKIEMPVMEDCQMGISIGLAMNEYLPVTCFPRFDFVLLALNQLINHLDKIQTMSRKQFRPRVFIRTAVGAKKPLNGGPQHTQNYSKVLRLMCNEIKVIELKNKKKIFKEFENAYKSKDLRSYLFIEYSDMYND